jgi:diguanylate cyclase (GGDEF)-like protein
MSSLGNLGIVPRLTIAFAAVAVLAAAANLIAKGGAKIVYGEPAVIAPAPVVIRPPVLAAPPVEKQPADTRVLTSEELLLAVDRFERAVRARLDGDTEFTAQFYADARKEFEAAAKAYIAAARELSGRSFAKLNVGVKNHVASAATLLNSSDSRHKSLLAYSATFERMDATLKTSLDGAWKILGRVVARQSLLQLSTDLNAMRPRLSSQLEDSTAAAIKDVLRSEQAFQDTLLKNEKSLRRSQGDEWYIAMRTELEELTSLHGALLALDEQRQGETQKFYASAIALKAAIPKKVTAPVPVAAASRKLAPVVKIAPDTLVETPQAPVARPVAMSEDQNPQSSRMLVAWISAAVLLLLVYISYGTVRSIVQPVRRLLDATARLARGETPKPIPRGGIRELDNLAVAFNVMAEQLTAAQAATRDSHLLLEAKVEERTLQLQALAAHDPLTGLPNRRQLFALLDTAIERADREHGHVGVFFLDVDNFKNINDSIGHEFGDHVLVSIAQRLQDVARNFGFAARLGGDEFTLVYERASSIADIREAGLGIVQAFQAPLEVEGRDLIVSVSLGVSIYPEHERESEALLRAADAALFRAKALGRSQMALFTPELLTAAAAKFSIEQGLRRAIERSEFELFFQPEVCAETLEVRLVEALIRWRMPDGRYVAPGEFLAVAEESGLIIEISDWVLRTAIQTAARWHRGSWPQARVAINVSPRQLLDYRFVERVQELLREYALPPECIEIELTESVLQTGHATIEALKRLRALGLAIALDDFGTGYSSLASLEQLPLTRIKLDRSLIASIDSNPRSAAIARAIMSLCQGLGLEITAEGVERPEQFALLFGHRAMYMQGYLLARPAPAGDLEAMMRTVQQKCEELLVLQKAAAMESTVVDLMPVLPRRAAN